MTYDYADASRRNLFRYVTQITLFMRHGANSLVSVVLLVWPPSESTAGCRTFAASLAIWSVYRMCTRSVSMGAAAVDYVAVIAACLMTPMLVSGPHFHLVNNAPVVIAGTAVISFTIVTSMRMSIAMTVGIVIAFATGASAVVGWDHVGGIFNIYYFAVQWVTATAVRTSVLRVADSVDAARSGRLAAELDVEVNAAVREYDREQMRLLHDTVASTLLMVGTGTSLAPERVAAQSRRDLQVLGDRLWVEAPYSDLVAVLRGHAVHSVTPVEFVGAEALWLDGKTAGTVAAAAREALTNVDRHAKASAVVITVGSGSVQVRDDGCGFDSMQPSSRHGVANSIIARMQGIGGSAAITAKPGQGTVVELSWPTDRPPAETGFVDQERLVERARRWYGLALTGYAVINLLAMISAAPASAGHRPLQLASGALALLATVSAVPRTVGWCDLRSRWAVVVLVVIAQLQSFQLPVDELGTSAQWSQATIGWCVLPLLLNERLWKGAAVLIGCWTLPAVFAAFRDPSVHTIVNIGYGTASILCVQLCALSFDNLIGRAGRAAGVETDTRTRLIASERIAEALQAEYRRRYADLADTVRPLLTVMAQDGCIDANTRRRSQVEYQRLRTLFDQSSTFDHPLLRELRPHIDAAEDRGVAASINIVGSLPSMTDLPARHISQQIGTALSLAGTSVRITASAKDGALEISFVGRGMSHIDTLTHLAADRDHGCESALTVLDDTVWLTVGSAAERST